jgi:hypothetical protein
MMDALKKNDRSLSFFSMTTGGCVEELLRNSFDDFLRLTKRGEEDESCAKKNYSG